MNKQEAIESIKKLEEYYGFSKGVYLEKRDVINIISQIDEPQKVTVPKFVAEMLEIYKAKNKDYGDSFSESFEEFGLIAPVVRMNDKMNRIKSLSKKGDRQVKSESLRDSLMDLANYAMMTVVELDQQVEDWKKENFGTIESLNKNDYEAGRQENL